jgi:hypothetical protein
MGISTYPPAGGGAATLRQTITSAGAVTIPAENGLVYAAIGSSPTAIQAQGWVPRDTAYTFANNFYYFSFLVGTGPNLYLYY